jgi:integrase
MARVTKHYGKHRIRWTDEGRRRRSAVFEEHREAEDELKLREAEVVEAKRRGVVRPRGERTFEMLLGYYERNRLPQLRSPKDHASIIRRHLRPTFGGATLRDITTQIVDEFSSNLHAQLSPKTVANILTLLGILLRLAIDLEWIEKLPKIRKPKPSQFGESERFLEQSEIRRVLSAAHERGADVHALYATAAYSGMREGELACLEWSDIDFDRRLICVRRSFNGPTKNGKVRYVPILDALLPVLRAWRLRCSGKLVFPNASGKRHGPSARIFQETLHAVLKSAGLPSDRKRGELKPHVTFHGLRHSFASNWVVNGGDIFRLQKILGHSSVTQTMRYAHLAPDAFVEDYSRLGQPLGETANVTALPRASILTPPPSDNSGSNPNKTTQEQTNAETQDPTAKSA